VEHNADEAPSDRPSTLIGAVDNVLRLLRLFEDHEMIRVNQVARDMGLSRSTVHRMLATLSHHEFVEQDEYSRAYRPGPALVDIGLAVISKFDIRAVSHSALVELRDLTGETAHVGIMRGATSVLFLDSVESDRIVRTGSRIGRILPAHSTATGKALLAEQTDDEVAALYPAGVMEAPTPRALTTLEELLDQLAEVRRLGQPRRERGRCRRGCRGRAGQARPRALRPGRQRSPVACHRRVGEDRRRRDHAGRARARRPHQLRPPSRESLLPVADLWYHTGGQCSA
jgi:IclR family acetate operon transcriptional repressor